MVIYKFYAFYTFLFRKKSSKLIDYSLLWPHIYENDIMVLLIESEMTKVSTTHGYSDVSRHFPCHTVTRKVSSLLNTMDK